jgi:hypothetical protein
MFDDFWWFLGIHQPPWNHPQRSCKEERQVNPLRLWWDIAIHYWVGVDLQGTMVEPC